MGVAHLKSGCVIPDQKPTAHQRTLRVSLESESYSAKINLPKTEVSTAQTRRQHSWNRYQEASRMLDTRLSKAKAAIEKAEERMKYAKSYFNMHRELFEKVVIYPREFKESKEKHDVSEKELEESQAEL